MDDVENSTSKGRRPSGRLFFFLCFELASDPGPHRAIPKIYVGFRNKCEILEIAATTKTVKSPHERAGGV
jgi:hypothetical protein